MYRSWVGIYPPSYINVVSGQLDLQLRPTSVYRSVVKITMHKEFDKDTLENDIAIIEVSGGTLQHSLWTKQGGITFLYLRR